MREMPLDRSLAFTALLDHDPTPERVTELLTAWYAQDETLDLWAFAREWLGIRNPRSWNRTDRIVCENTVHLASAPGEGEGKEEAEPFSDTYGYDFRADAEHPYVSVYDAADGRLVKSHLPYSEAYSRYGDASWPTL